MTEPKARILNTKKPVLMQRGHTDSMQTPAYALDPLLPYLPPDWRIWECAAGHGLLVSALRVAGLITLGSDINSFERVTDPTRIVANFYSWEPEPMRIDCIVTNPPYTEKDKFLRRCYELDKPFALLMPLTALESYRRISLYRRYGIQLIIPDRRINFITPRGGKSSWFPVAWFTYGFNLPQQLNFVHLERPKGES